MNIVESSVCLCGALESVYGRTQQQKRRTRQMLFEVLIGRRRDRVFLIAEH